MHGMDQFELRPMTPTDADAAVALASAQGWRNRQRFYELVFRVRTARPLVGVIGGRIMATGIATASGPVGWLGAIVVDATVRRRGHGRAMTEELMRLLRAEGCTTLSLEATDAGRPMYEQMGFRVVTHYHQIEAGHLDEAPGPPAGARVRSLVPADLPALFALDREATAEDRSAALAVLAAMGGGRVLESAGGPSGGPIRGFLLPAERSYGVIVAPRFEDGLYLLDLHRSVVPAGGSVRAGIPDEHPAATEALLARGWRETWQAPRLLLGLEVPWRPTWIWGQINSAMG
jgi:GNAT superfamily N-acetyltransferase